MLKIKPMPKRTIKQIVERLFTYVDRYGKHMHEGIGNCTPEAVTKALEEIAESFREEERILSASGRSFSMSCSCSAMVLVEMTTRSPVFSAHKIAGIK